ncbi:hypothetical protein Lalb_Chr04g0258661 [Lupinus albus]|uniref:Uncharacterized protein n=1 Tax=Lupinus albus TaxID=3870 RepID=A0A6A4QME6_LUPAL|nr:hypothetical protein Lalb_Chr04g0258661 [Lupinus albus]
MLLHFLALSHRLCTLLCVNTICKQVLPVIFLGFDVFFAILCILLACLIGIAICCSFSCINAFLYAVAVQKSASDADLIILPRYRFRILSNDEKATGGAGAMFPVENDSSYLAKERILLPEDTVCIT